MIVPKRVATAFLKLHKLFKKKNLTTSAHGALVSDFLIEWTFPTIRQRSLWYFYETAEKLQNDAFECTSKTGVAEIFSESSKVCLTAQEIEGCQNN